MSKLPVTNHNELSLTKNSYGGERMIQTLDSIRRNNSDQPVAEHSITASLSCIVQNAL